MKLMYFLAKYAPGSLAFAMVAGIISGACNAGLLATFNAALRDSDGSKHRLVWSFAAIAAFLPVTRFISEYLLARLSQSALFDLRMNLSEQVINTPLRRFEEIGTHRLMAALTDDIPTVTNTLVFVPVVCINAAIAISGLVYLGILSGSVLLAVLAFMALGIVSYQLSLLRALSSFRQARQETDVLFNHFRDLTMGIKELKLHRRRRRAFLTQVLRSTAASLKGHNVRGMTIFTAASSWGQVLVFIVVGLVLFALPEIRQISIEALTGYTITLLYLMTPFQVIMNSLPNLGRANVALQKVESLGFELKDRGMESESPMEPSSSSCFETLELAGVSYAYKGKNEFNNFVLGPLDMMLHVGELVFIIGGNGSGKTTFAKILAGLYPPDTGEIRVDGAPVTEETREYYRQHMSVIFSDFHLFSRLLGLEQPDLDANARDYLSRFGLSHKVDVRNGNLSTTDLSRGEQKRLALLTAYLENRPIYIFDEWAADQDPSFREIFYRRLLPELKARGKAVLVISHDDRYYGMADRIIKLEYGQIEFDRSRCKDDLQLSGSAEISSHFKSEV